MLDLLLSLACSRRFCHGNRGGCDRCCFRRTPTSQSCPPTSLWMGDQIAQAESIGSSLRGRSQCWATLPYVPSPGSPGYYTRVVESEQAHTLVCLLVGGSKPRRHCGVPRHLASRGGGPGGGHVLAATLTTSPRRPRPSVLLRRWWLLVASLLVEAAELTFDEEPQ